MRLFSCVRSAFGNRAKHLIGFRIIKRRIAFLLPDFILRLPAGMLGAAQGDFVHLIARANVSPQQRVQIELDPHAQQTLFAGEQLAGQFRFKPLHMLAQAQNIELARLGIDPGPPAGGLFRLTDQMRRDTISARKIQHLKGPRLEQLRCFRIRHQVDEFATLRQNSRQVRILHPGHFAHPVLANFICDLFINLPFIGDVAAWGAALFVKQTGIFIRVQTDPNGPPKAL